MNRRLLLAFPLLVALSAGLGALSADFEPPPPAWTRQPAAAPPAITPHTSPTQQAPWDNVGRAETAV